MKRRKRLRRVLSGTLAVCLCVALNISPLTIIGEALIDCGMIDRFSNLGKNILNAATMNETHAAVSLTIPNGEQIVSGCDCPDYTSILSQIRSYDRTSSRHLNDIEDLTVNIDDNVTEILGVCKDINSNIEYIQQQLGYDPTAKYGTKNVKESLDNLSHRYRVANLHSLNNEFGGALWRPYSKDIEYLTEFSEISGAFSNVYTGYWDTGVNEVNYNALPESRSLEVLGPDAILRTEGINPIATVVKEDETSNSRYEFVSRVAYVEATEEYATGGLHEIAPGESGMNTSTAVVYYDEMGELTSDPTASHAIPTATLLSLTQQTIPAVDITWLDAVTVLYKALGQDVTTLQGFYAINPDITTENSPLAKELAGVTDLDGYDYYIYATRANPIEYNVIGTEVSLTYNYIYWKKAVNEGFVNATTRDMVISAVDFYTLAKKMMIAYGEEEITDAEMQMLLKVYGSYYPVQLGETVANSWAYLKAKGVLADGTEPEGYECSLTRAQLLDMCARIKDKSYRATYKNINLQITLDDMILDRGFYPYYDFKIAAKESTYVTTTIDYKSMDYYTYLLPQTTEVNLGYNGAGFIFNNKDSQTDVDLVPGAVYNGMVELDLENNNAKHYYYVLQIPKNYNGNIFLKFVNTLNPGSENGTVDAIEINPTCYGGGIYTQYTIQDGVATTCDPEPDINYYSFAEFPNNEDMLWYNDNIRSDEERPTSYSVASNATPLQKFVSAVDKWTSPMEVLAAGPPQGIVPNVSNEYVLTFDPIPSSDDNGTYMSRFQLSNAEGVYDNRSHFTLDGEDYYYTDNEDGLLKMIKGNPIFSAITKACIATRLDLNSIAAAISSGGNVNQYNTLGYVIGNPKTVIDKAGNVSIKDAATYHTDMTTKSFYNLYFTNVGEWSSYSGDNTDSISIELAEKLRNKNNEDSSQKAIDNILSSTINTDETLKVYGLGYNTTNKTAGFYVTGTNKGARAFAEMLDKIRTDNEGATWSAIGESSNVDFNVDKTLQTSILMSVDKQYMVSWTTLVKMGIANATEPNGKPTLDEEQQIYEFYTSNGVVRIDDLNHIIQIGTQIYVFDHEDNTEPTLVVRDESGELYFDVRCITGVSNKSGYTLDAGRASKTERTIGSGKFTVLCLSSTSTYDTGSMKTRQINCYTFGDNKEVNSTPVADTANPINVIVSTQYDGKESNDGKFTYWDGNDATNARLPLSTMLPTANWIMVTSDDNKVFSGRLYVFYLKKAFTEEIVTSPDGGSTSKIGGPNPAFEAEWADMYAKGSERLERLYPGNGFEKTFNSVYGEEDDWYIQMTKAALVNLYADTGEFWSSEAYVARCFDFSNSGAANCKVETDFREGSIEAAESKGNESGGLYFLDYLGFIYNMPTVEEFTLEDYYCGKYPLPLAFNERDAVINFNMNFYGQDSSPSGNSIPLGYELTPSGFVHYKENTKIISDPSYIKSTSNTQNNQQVQSTVAELPFSLSAGYTAAPSGMFARYGLFRNADYDRTLDEITVANTTVNDYYWGTRRVCMDDTSQSTDAGYRNWKIGASCFNAFRIGVNTEAIFVHKYLNTNSSRSCYIINTNNLEENNLLNSEITNIFGLATEEDTWSGRASLINILNFVDRSSNWIIWTALTLAPMICVILMTILIGLSFITDSKIWLYFCEKFFDPIRILTFGVRDSNHWHWKKVLVPCIITYIAFALLCNANILKIIIWVVDAWMRLMNAIK